MNKNFKVGDLVRAFNGGRWEYGYIERELMSEYKNEPKLCIIRLTDGKTVPIVDKSAQRVYAGWEVVANSVGK